ncbi:phage virion morphogenesis protein [Neptuniibacter marinus]|uniref:phage virion morphogenesis protein n=1 Tax=Neptuniibacter marinus TaxID=1806670 RepID=UPI003B5AB7D9
MTGVKLEYNANVVQVRINNAINQLEKPAPLFAIINEYLLQAHRQRFKEQRSPAGVPWAPLSPRYKRRKHRNQNKILALRGHLQGTLRGQYDNEGLEFGTNRIYGAIHQFGGDIKRKQRSTTLYFKRARDGSVGNRFVKKSRSNFAQDATVGGHSVHIPARPWLGTSADDDQTILNKALEYMDNALSG